MIDLFLRSADVAALDTALQSAGLADENGDLAANTWLDRIGQDPVTVDGVDEEGDPVTTTHPGYHANLRLLEPLGEEQASALADIVIAAPANPMRVWA